MGVSNQKPLRCIGTERNIQIGAATNILSRIENFLELRRLNCSDLCDNYTYCDRILNRTEKSSTARSVDSQRRKNRPASPSIASSLSEVPLYPKSSEKFWARCPGALAVTRRIAPWLGPRILTDEAIMLSQSLTFLGPRASTPALGRLRPAYHCERRLLEAPAIASRNGS